MTSLTCGDCLKFRGPKAPGEHGSCHGVPPAVAVLKGVPETVYPEVDATSDACPLHPRWQSWLDAEARERNRVAGQDYEDTIDPLPGYDCTCWHLGGGEGAGRVRIEGNDRWGTANRDCPVCHGTGISGQPALRGTRLPLANNTPTDIMFDNEELLDASGNLIGIGPIDPR